MPDDQQGPELGLKLELCRLTNLNGSAGKSQNQLCGFETPKLRTAVSRYQPSSTKLLSGCCELTPAPPRQTTPRQLLLPARLEVRQLLPARLEVDPCLSLAILLYKHTLPSPFWSLVKFVKLYKKKCWPSDFRTFRCIQKSTLSPDVPDHKQAKGSRRTQAAREDTSSNRDGDEAKLLQKEGA